MPLLRPVRGPIRWPSCWTWGLPPCSAGGGSSPVLGTDWIAVKAATAWCLTVLATRSASESCSPVPKRISKGRRQPLILHADNGNAMRAATLESRLEELGVLRSFSRPRVSNDNPYSESLFHTVKYRPDYPRRPFQSVAEACSLVAASGS